MLKYLDFITEGTVGNYSAIYYAEALKEYINSDWYDISVAAYSYPTYEVRFRVREEDEKYNYYSVLFEKGDTYFMDDDGEMFIKKFREEFWKHPQEYIENMKKYIPKCLDAEHVKQTNKYNI